MNLSKRKIAIIGAGQAGLQLAIFLLKQKNYTVTLYTDRSAEEIRRGRIMSSQVLFNAAVQKEKILGINFWDNQCIQNTTVSFSLAESNSSKRAIHWVGQVEPYQSIDQRLKLPQWMEYFEELGGELVIQEVDEKILDNIASKHELTMVSGGKREISQLFLRDHHRSPFHTPQRALACLAVKGVLPSTTSPGSRISVIPNVGEFFTTPGLTHNGECEMMVFEGIPGLAFDSWERMTHAQDFIEHAKKMLSLFIPWEAERCADMELADSNAFLAGRFTPTVRQPTFISACGKAILGLGDTFVLNDPIAAQGANHACKSAFLYGKAIMQQGDQPFDQKWMLRVAELSWQTYGRPACELSELLLAPPRESDLRFSTLAMEDQVLANKIANGFDDPASLSWLLTPDIEECVA